MSIDRRSMSGGYMPLRDAIDRLFQGSVITPQAMGQGGFPPTDLFVTDDDVVIEMAIPGVNPDDINISVTGDTVSITGEVQHHRHGQQGQQLYLDEMWRGKFQRVFSLPTQVDANNAKANYEGGILTLTMPKSEATKPRKIQVQQQQTIGGQQSSDATQRETIPVSGGSSSEQSGS